MRTILMGLCLLAAVPAYSQARVLCINDTTGDLVVRKKCTEGKFTRLQTQAALKGDPGPTGPAGDPGNNQLVAFANIASYTDTAGYYTVNSFGGQGTTGVSAMKFFSEGYYDAIFTGSYPELVDVEPSEANKKQLTVQCTTTIHSATSTSSEVNCSAVIFSASQSELQVVVIVQDSLGNAKKPDQLHISVMIGQAP